MLRDGRRGRKVVETSMWVERGQGERCGSGVSRERVQWGEEVEGEEDRVVNPEAWVYS